MITTITGNGTPGFTGDGGPALNAQLNIPVGLCLDAAGNIYLGDIGNQRIRRIDKITGFITTIAGTGTAGFSGDGGPALNAALNEPFFLCVDNNRNCLYFSDFLNYRIRKIDLSSRPTRGICKKALRHTAKQRNRKRISKGLERF